VVTALLSIGTREIASDYKFMATFHNMTGPGGTPVVRCYVKGAPDVLISRGGSYRAPDGTLVPVTEDNRSLALEANDPRTSCAWSGSSNALGTWSP
jgi:Ca2+-transporting ATPase